MLSESETESKQKIRRNKVRFHCLIAFRWIPNTKTLNTQFKIWNTQLSQKEVGKYPIATNPYLELCIYGQILTGPQLIYGQMVTGPQLIYAQILTGPQLIYGQMLTGPQLIYCQILTGPQLIYGQMLTGPQLIYAQMLTGPQLIYAQMLTGPQLIYGQMVTGPQLIYGQILTGPQLIYAQMLTGPQLIYAQMLTGPQLIVLLVRWIWGLNPKCWYCKFNVMWNIMSFVVRKPVFRVSDQVRCKHDFLFDYILYVPVNNFTVISGQVFLGWTSTKQGKMCLAQGHNTVTPVGSNPRHLNLSQALYSTESS